METKNMKRRIADTFIELLKHKNGDKITVKDLIEECGISRQTFYYHFQDVMDVVEWSLHDKMESALKESCETKTPEEAIQIFIHYMMENRILVLRMLQSKRVVELKHKIMTTIYSYLDMLIREKAKELTISHKDLDFAIQFYTYGLTSFMLEKCKEKEIDEKMLANQIFRLLNGEITLFEIK